MRKRIEALLAALGRHARHDADYLWFPDVATLIAPCVHMVAYQMVPLVRFYELTRNETALRYAEHLSRWAFYHDPTVTSDGVITKTTSWAYLLDSWRGLAGTAGWTHPRAGAHHREVRQDRIAYTSSSKAFPSACHRVITRGRSAFRSCCVAASSSSWKSGTLPVPRRK